MRCPKIVTVAICDPELTIGLPPKVTAATGMDALTHCIETFCSPAVNPPADAIALDGMRRIFHNLERAVRQGSDRDARWNMMMGSLEGALCFQKGLGSVHALAHTLGALGFHHGTLNAVLLPHVLAYNEAILGEKASIILRQSGQPAEDLPTLVRALDERIGMPVRLRDMGVDARCLEDVAARAMEDNAHKTNPRSLSKEDYLAILRTAY
ncbi:1,3-propanediol dehydrogenase [Castellaniella defragrans]